MNGPLFPGHLKVDFGDLVALEKAFKENGDRIAGFLFEPIQGEAGVVIPHDGYLKSVRDLCSKYNILMIADEIQSSLARSGKLMACDWEEVRPDVVILGKALGGGVIPVSAVLAEKDVMLCIRPGEHGRAEATKDDRFGDLSRSQYGLVDLAAALFYRACVNRDKPSSSEKRVKREHADACLREELKKGKWLWNAAFCCLTHNYKRRMSKILFIYWFEGIIVSFERIMNDASMGHNYDGLLWTLRSSQELSFVLLLPDSEVAISSSSSSLNEVSFVLHFMLLHKEMLPRMGI
ncbi:uncharacterized protein LOC133817967 isoform X10 [Humulus lupulus]|uniref:uncharacterized protein LOC133817967 isoform X10 n=1 Tax=Humulus lupulus TaxID=3486 RepID=UPI002B4070B8|nr:uncharacterized protein LOC133817967 isoform X10 [Humulus lupulus]